MKRVWWLLFFLIWPVLVLVISVLAPTWNWGFPGNGRADSPLGEDIDHLFYVILILVTIVFIGTQVGLLYVLYSASGRKADRPAWYTHGNHRLEAIWTIIPGAILLFLAFYQMRVWANFRIESAFPEAARQHVVAEVTARQFEWRIRYPAPGKKLEKTPRLDDMYDVNIIHVPAGTPVTIQLRTQDVQHSFFLPSLRIKQDALPGHVIPVWFEVSQPGEYPLVCAELCGWGHYKMAGKVIAHAPEDYEALLQRKHIEQMDDGYREE